MRSADDARRKKPRWRLLVALGGLAAALVAALVFGRGAAARWAHWSAAGHLEDGAIGPAEQSLAWAAWVDPGNPRTELLRAAAQRRLGQLSDWESAVAAAEAAGAAKDAVELERRLGRLRFGQAQSVSSDDYQSLVTAGALPLEASEAVVHGLLAQGRRAEAEQLIDLFAASTGEAAQASLLRGVTWRSAGEREMAQAEFEQALAARPHDELARLNLAQLYEEQDQFSQALEHIAALVAAAPGRQSARVDAARLARKLGRLDDARQIMAGVASGKTVPAAVALEWASIEYESGNYDEARHWFEQADLEGQHISETLRTAAANYAYAGDPARAEELFFRTEEAQARARQAGEWQRRLAINPNDAVAAEQLRLLAERPAALRPAGVTESAAEISPLFGRHCAVCHGPDGEGDGRAARHLFPRPRNLRRDKYRLVSTANHVPTEDDIERVIAQGIPGTSMPAFPKLAAEERALLVRDVLLLYGQRSNGGDSSEGSLDAEALPIPTIDAASPASIAEGRAVYQRSGCQQCHGADGSPVDPPLLFDEERRPTFPRDLVRDLLKGGADGSALYRRIRLGMPGTPHPASPGLTDAEAVALVHFCQSLGQESPQPKRQLTNHQRLLQAAGH